jgi:hypothetical protein
MAIIRPTNLVKPFADSGSKNTIPVTSQIGITDGAASYTDGFPPLTWTPIEAGGKYPFGQDFNGILHALSQHIMFINSGGQYRFDAALATAVGGYPVGFVLQDDDGVNSYINNSAGNTTNFNTTPSSIGVTWMPFSANIQATEALRGGAEIATHTETNTGTDDARIVTPLKLKLGFSISLSSTTGYLNFPTWLGGLEIKWGQSLNTGTTTTVTFGTAFTTAVRGLFFGSLASSLATAANHYQPSYDNFSTTSFQWASLKSDGTVNATASSANVYWLAIGY